MTLNENQRLAYNFDPQDGGLTNPHAQVFTFVALKSLLYWDSALPTPSGWAIVDGTNGTYDCTHYTLSHPGAPTLVMIQKMA